MTRTVRSRGDTFDVTLSPDGDHIVIKNNKRDPAHGFPVSSDTGTWARVVALAIAETMDA